MTICVDTYVDKDGAGDGNAKSSCANDLGLGGLTGAFGFSSRGGAEIISGGVGEENCGGAEVGVFNHANVSCEPFSRDALFFNTRG